MKILWIVSVELPELSLLQNKTPQPFGGWLDYSSRLLSEREDISLYIANASKSKEALSLKGKNITYFTFHEKNMNQYLAILKEVKPDVIHFYGTEKDYTLPCVKVSKAFNYKTVISVQGHIGEYAKYLKTGLSDKVIHGSNLRNIIKNDNVHNLSKKYAKRGKKEVEAILLAKNVIGRTAWDYAATAQFKKDINYFKCNETLRKSFYENSKKRDNVTPYSLFISQADYSIKGFHFVLDALTLLTSKYSNIHLYVAGKKLTGTSFKEKLLETYYQRYLMKRIKKEKLTSFITFLGPLNETQMVEEYLKAHAFILPSMIENSPNSLGEAMLLGVPLVATYVGGIPTMITHEREGYLYQYDSPIMLAHYIDKIFSGKEDGEMLAKARAKALVTHDIELNTKTLVDIYKEIYKGS